MKPVLMKLKFNHSNCLQIVILLFLFGLKSCNYTRKTIMPKETYNSIIEEANYVNIGVFLDSNFRKKDDLDNYIQFNLLDSNGKIKSINDYNAVSFFSDSIISSSKNELLIGELIDSDRIVLFGKSNGMWSTIQVMVELNVNRDSILRLTYLQNGEASGYGDKISNRDWYKQFDNTQNSGGLTYSLIQDGREIINGKNRIDGITGSTRTSEASINLINLVLSEYKRRLKGKM